MARIVMSSPHAETPIAMTVYALNGRRTADYLQALNKCHSESISKPYNFLNIGNLMNFHLISFGQGSKKPVGFSAEIGASGEHRRSYTSTFLMTMPRGANDDGDKNIYRNRAQRKLGS